MALRAYAVVNNTRRVCSALARLVGELPAIHAAWQADIGKQQLDLRMSRQKLQSGSAMSGFQYAVAELAQRFAAVVADISSSSTTRIVSAGRAASDDFVVLGLYLVSSEQARAAGRS